MFSLCCGRSATILLLLSFLASQVLGQTCNTDQNPYCAGNSKFEELCCPYPAVCYWADRYGAIGCCQPGQICTADGATIAPTLYGTYTTYATPTASTLIQLSTQGLGTTGNIGYSTITVTGGVAEPTAATAVRYTTTGGVIIVNDARRATESQLATQFSLGLAILAWIIF